MNGPRTTNERQALYYESRFDALENSSDEVAANKATNLWTKIRRKVVQRFDDKVGLNEKYENIQLSWISDKIDGCVLDLGCFSGNSLSLTLASRADEYIGIDLSTKAIDELQRKLQSAKCLKAKTISGDFLDSNFEDEKFDLIYARSVLHHFSNVDELCLELHRVLKPGGIIVSYDPLATTAFNKIARALYRPFQTDSDWEWPFTHRTLESIESTFNVEAVRGFRGLSKAGYPVFAVSPKLATRIGKYGDSVDERFASVNSLYLRMFCWNIMLKLRKGRSSVTHQNPTIDLQY